MDLLNLSGFVLPLLVDFINKKVTNSNLKFLVSLLVSALVGVIANFNKLDWNNWGASAAVIFTTSQIVYKLYWEKSEARKTIVK